MSGESNRISGSSRIGSPIIERVRPAATSESAVPSPGADTGLKAGVDNGSRFGPRGSRMLPADYPVENLDRRAQRGTYLDILV
jgi:hypothetical protein